MAKNQVQHFLCQIVPKTAMKKGDHKVNKLLTRKISYAKFVLLGRYIPQGPRPI